MKSEGLAETTTWKVSDLLNRRRSPRFYRLLRSEASGRVNYQSHESELETKEAEQTARPPRLHGRTRREGAQEERMSCSRP